MKRPSEASALDAGGPHMGSPQQPGGSPSKRHLRAQLDIREGSTSPSVPPERVAALTARLKIEQQFSPSRPGAKPAGSPVKEEHHYYLQQQQQPRQHQGSPLGPTTARRGLASNLMSQAAAAKKATTMMARRPLGVGPWGDEPSAHVAPTPAIGSVGQPLLPAQASWRYELDAGNGAARAELGTQIELELGAELVLFKDMDQPDDDRMMRLLQVPSMQGKQVAVNLPLAGHHHCSGRVEMGRVRCDQCSSAAEAGRERPASPSHRTFQGTKEEGGSKEEEEEEALPYGTFPPAAFVSHCCGSAAEGFCWWDVVEVADVHMTVEDVGWLLSGGVDSALWYCLYCRRMAKAPLQICSTCPAAFHGACYSKYAQEEVGEAEDWRCASCAGGQVAGAVTGVAGPSSSSGAHSLAAAPATSLVPAAPLAAHLLAAQGEYDQDHQQQEQQQTPQSRAGVLDFATAATDTKTRTISSSSASQPLPAANGSNMQQPVQVPPAPSQGLSAGAHSKQPPGTEGATAAAEGETAMGEAATDEAPTGSAALGALLTGLPAPEAAGAAPAVTPTAATAAASGAATGPAAAAPASQACAAAMLEQHNGALGATSSDAAMPATLATFMPTQQAGMYVPLGAGSGPWEDAAGAGVAGFISMAPALSLLMSAQAQGSTHGMSKGAYNHYNSGAAQHMEGPAAAAAAAAAEPRAMPGHGQQHAGAWDGEQGPLLAGTVSTPAGGETAHHTPHQSGMGGTQLSPSTAPCMDHLQLPPSLAHPASAAGVAVGLDGSNGEPSAAEGQAMLQALAAATPLDVEGTLQTFMRKKQRTKGDREIMVHLLQLHGASLPLKLLCDAGAAAGLRLPGAGGAAAAAAGGGGGLAAEGSSAGAPGSPASAASSGSRGFHGSGGADEEEYALPGWGGSTPSPVRQRQAASRRGKSLLGRSSPAKAGHNQPSWPAHQPQQQQHNARKPAAGKRSGRVGAGSHLLRGAGEEQWLPQAARGEDEEDAAAAAAHVMGLGAEGQGTGSPMVLRPREWAAARGSSPEPPQARSRSSSLDRDALDGLLQLQDPAHQLPMVGEGLAPGVLADPSSQVVAAAGATAWAGSSWGGVAGQYPYLEGLPQQQQHPQQWAGMPHLPPGQPFMQQQFLYNFNGGMGAPWLLSPAGHPAYWAAAAAASVQIAQQQAMAAMQLGPSALMGLQAAGVGADGGLYGLMEQAAAQAAAGSMAAAGGGAGVLGSGEPAGGASPGSPLAQQGSPIGQLMAQQGSPEAAATAPMPLSSTPAGNQQQQQQQPVTPGDGSAAAAAQAGLMGGLLADSTWYRNVVAAAAIAASGGPVAPGARQGGGAGPPACVSPRPAGPHPAAGTPPSRGKQQ